MNLSALPPGALRAALPVVTIVGAVVAGVTLGIELAILIVASGALLGVVALLWASVQSLTGESPITLEEALGLGAPSVEEEQKRAVLRALKDLEFERSVGKISEEDYAELSARYREDAKRLMQALDQSSEPARARVDKLVAERVASGKRRKKHDDDETQTSADGGEQADAGTGTDAAPESDAPREEAESAPAESDAPREEAESKDGPASERARAGGESS
ncbi:MAG TPA: hypothetical protein VGK73_40130 [Polyangiaceae bacterium]